MIAHKNLVATMVHSMLTPYFYKMWNSNTMGLFYKSKHTISSTMSYCSILSLHEISFLSWEQVYGLILHAPFIPCLKQWRSQSTPYKWACVNFEETYGIYKNHRVLLGESKVQVSFIFAWHSHLEIQYGLKNFQVP